MNYGVPTSKSKTKQITDTIGMLEAYAEVDKSLADLNGNSAEWRLSEDKAFLEGMNQNLAKTMFYGDSSIDSERFMGLSPRYNSLAAANGGNIIDAGGTAAVNTSIWLIYWGENAAHGIYPKGSKAGLQHNDLGEHTLIDPNGGKYQGLRTHYKWDCGFTLRDWRKAVRIANVDWVKLQTASDAVDTSANVLKYMTQAIGLITEAGNERPAFYVNRLVYSMLMTKILNSNNMFLSIGDYMGKPRTLTFMGIPVRKVWETSLLNTESRVV